MTDEGSKLQHLGLVSLFNPAATATFLPLFQGLPTGRLYRLLSRGSQQLFQLPSHPTISFLARESTIPFLQEAYCGRFTGGFLHGLARGPL